jgi:hypothetical protein
MARGSSRIIAIAVTVTGGIGPTGATGITGASGSYVTGPTGSDGYGVIGVTYSRIVDGATFTISNGTSFFLTGIRGNTGNGVTVDAPYINYFGTGIAPLLNETSSVGYTLFFRSISYSSGISASISGETIYIQNNTGYTGSFDANKLLFVNFSQSESKYFIDSADNVSYFEKTYAGVTYARLNASMKVARDSLTTNNFNYSTGSVEATNHTGLTLTIDAAFYGITGIENGLTSDSWKPYLKFRASYYDVDGSSGATVGMINFSPIGPYTKKIYLNSLIGSCCFDCDECEGYESGRNCVDYVSKSYCDSVLGRWSQSNCYARQSSYDCYPRRACCVNGTCVNATQLKCSQMNGVFCSSKICGDSYDCSMPCTPGLLPATATTYCCCKDGVGTETTDRTSCVGIIVEGSCTGVNCCDFAGNTGACCLPNGSCLELTADECARQFGTYKGTGVTCTSQLCCQPITT